MHSLGQKRSELSHALTAAVSPLTKLHLIAHYLDFILRGVPFALAESYILEALPHFISFLNQYDGFGVYCNNQIKRI